LAESLLIGASTADITPPVGAMMAGYKQRQSTSLGHTLRAEALACRSGDDGWILITSDTIGFSRDDVAVMRASISRACGLPGEAIMVSSTHTHSGPVTVFGTDEKAELDSRYLASLKDALVGCAVEAWESACPGLFETAWTCAPELGSNRRVQLEDGSWGNEWQDPDGKHPGYFDPTVMLVGVRRPNGSLTALVVGYGCHPVTLGPPSLAISADYPGYMKDRLESLGVAPITAFINAGGGNINPRTAVLAGAEHPKAVGEALADIVAAAVEELRPVAAGPIRYHREPWSIVRTRENSYRKDQDGFRKGDTIPTEVQALRAGDLVFIGFPGELFSEYQKMLRDASPVSQTMPMSLANDCVAYFVTDEAFAQGGYEAKHAPCEGLEGQLMDHARKAFREVAP
jgi:hypothetical protein